jgi:two-component system, NtrC family, response regulator AtoC
MTTERGEKRSADSGALQLAVFDGEDVTIYSLPSAGSVSIGRADGNDIRIDRSSVSRKHAVLHVGPPLQVEDLGGANGTRLRDPRALVVPGETHELRQIHAERVDIALGDCVLLGTTVVVVRRTSGGRLDDESGGTAGREVVRAREMVALYEQAARAAQSLISVLILGETGVGKDVLANAIHRASPRSRAPFLGLNCAAIPDSMLEGELFGHEKGSFTGAMQSRPGLFEAASGGTVFLDEVGELPLSTQVKLLRVLEDRRVMRVGGRRAIDVDVRFLAATNGDLEAAREKGEFRADLYYRLAGLVLNVPPLRVRREEIADLACLFAARSAQELDRKTPAIAEEAMKLLEQYNWPGNVRELRNAIERAVVLCSDVVLPEHLPARVLAPGAVAPSPMPKAATETQRSQPAGEPAEERTQAEAGQAEPGQERARILDALTACAGNQTRAAKLLGISRRTLVTRLRDYELPRPHARKA